MSTLKFTVQVSPVFSHECRLQRLAWKVLAATLVILFAQSRALAQTSSFGTWKDGIPSFRPVTSTGTGIPDVKPKIFSPRKTFQLPSYLTKSRESVLEKEFALPTTGQVPAQPNLPVQSEAMDLADTPLKSQSSEGVSGVSEDVAIVPHSDLGKPSTASDSTIVKATAFQTDALQFAPPSVQGESATPYLPVPPPGGDFSEALELPLPSPDQVPLPAGVGQGASEEPSGPIGNAIATDEIVEEAPLEPQTTAWYAVPWRWLRDGWENHAEFGLDGSDGNARTAALQTGLEMKRKTDHYTFAIDVDYRYARNSEGATEDSGRFNADYDRLIGDSKWAAFAKYGTEWDRFKVFDLRVNVNGGVSYHWIRTDDTELVTRFGAGASKEIGDLVPDDEWKAEAVFGFEGERQINRYNKMKAKVEYFPEWAEFGNFRLVTDLAWEILLDDDDNLSLKLAATDRYDSTPQLGDKANDIYYSLLLLMKF